MLKIGHRGTRYLPENTLESFQKALDLGVDGIELDVHLSKDMVPVVIHDETIDRTTSNNGYVKDFTASQLEKFGIPTLVKVLDLIDRKCLVNIEIKATEARNFVLEVIQYYLSEKKWKNSIFQISSFDWEVLEFISEKDKSIVLGVLTEDNIKDALAFAKRINAFSINPYFKLLHVENVNEIHQNGFKIFPWTVNSEEDITLVKSLEVDGIISDFPDKL